MTPNYRSTRLACYTAYVVQAITVNLPPLLFVIFRDRFGVTYEELGRLVLLNFVTQLTVDFLSGWFCDRLGIRRAAVLAHICCFVGLVSLGILPRVLTGSPYAALMAASIVYALGSGFLEVIISPTIESLPSSGKSASMSILHSFYCWGQAGVVLLSTLFLLAFGTRVWYLLPLIWALLPLCNLFFFLRVPLMPPLPPVKTATLRELLSSRTILLAFAVMVGAGASELAMSQWASMLAERGLGLTKACGDVMGPCLFAVFMGTTRVLGPRLYRRLRLTTVLLISGVFCIVCYALTVFSSLPALSLAGCALTGAAVALMWPATISLAAERIPNGGTRMFALLAAFGDIGCSLGPWLTGLVSDLVQGSADTVARAAAAGISAEQLGLKSGLTAAAVFPAVMIVCLLLLRRKKPNAAQ